MQNKAFTKYCHYLNSLASTRSLRGDFLSINVKDDSLLKVHNISNSRHMIDTLKEYGIINQTGVAKGGTFLYQIDKTNYVLSLLLNRTLCQISETTKRQLRQYNVNVDYFSLINDLKDALSNGYILSYDLNENETNSGIYKKVYLNRLLESVYIDLFTIVKITNKVLFSENNKVELLVKQFLDICNDNYIVDTDYFRFLYETKIEETKIRYNRNEYNRETNCLSSHTRTRVCSLKSVQKNGDIDFNLYKGWFIKEEKSKKIIKTKQERSMYEYFSKFNGFTLKDIFIPGECTEERKDAFLEYAIHNSKLLRNIEILNCELRELGYPSFCKLHVKTKRGNGGYFYWVSGRQWNDKCRLSKDYRINYMMGISKIDEEYDLSSAVETIIHGLNYNSINLDLKPRKALLTSYPLLDIPECKRDFVMKRIMKMSLFAYSCKDAYRIYGYHTVEIYVFWKTGEVIRTPKDEVLPVMDYEEFKKIYRAMRRIIGPFTQYKRNIFLIESYIELSVVKEMLSNGYSVANVFDCFYYSSKEITEEELKEIITKQANKFIRDLDYYKYSVPEDNLYFLNSNAISYAGLLY